MEIRAVGTTNCANIYKLKYLIPLCVCFWLGIYGNYSVFGQVLNQNICICGIGLGVIRRYSEVINFVDKVLGFMTLLYFNSTLIFILIFLMSYGSLQDIMYVWQLSFINYDYIEIISVHTVIRTSNEDIECQKRLVLHLLYNNR